MAWLKSEELSETTRIAAVKEKYKKYKLDITQETSLNPITGKSEVVKVYSEITIYPTDDPPDKVEINEALVELLQVVVGDDRIAWGTFYESMDGDKLKFRLVAGPDF